VKFWAAAVLFFGIGAAACAAIAWMLLGRGASVAAAVGVGATVGGLVAWLVFYLAAHSRRDH
jgi:hypothetical protein